MQNLNGFRLSSYFACKCLNAMYIVEQDYGASYAWLKCYVAIMLAHAWWVGIVSANIIIDF